MERQKLFYKFKEFLKAIRKQKIWNLIFAGRGMLTERKSLVYQVEFPHIFSEKN